MMVHQAGTTNTGAGRALGHEAALVYRFEGELRGGAKPVVGPEGTCFVHDLQATIVAGLLAGRHLAGLNQLTLRADGVGLMGGPGTIECGSGSVSLDVRGFLVTASDMAWPVPEIAAAPGFDFPDHDFPILGSVLVRTTDPAFKHLDGTRASVEGWVNFESGEVEVEARSM